MKILALESSATACSVALCEDEALIAQSFQNNGLTHSRTLMPMAVSLLDNCGTALDAVELIAVAAGPGSFTGLRIGVAAAKGLAWPGNKPCAACSTLESMAWPLAHLEGRVIVCAMDARRSQVYNALFHVSHGNCRRIREDRAISLADLGQELKNLEEPIFLVGDGSILCYNTLLETLPGLVLPPEHRMHQRAEGVALEGWRMAKEGDTVSGAELVPNYLRLSQAERERLERQTQAQ